MPDCRRALVTARMPSPWKVCPAPSLSSSTSFVKERSMVKRGLEQHSREPHRDRRHEENQREHEQAHEDVWHHGPEDVSHRDLRRRYALHGHEEEPFGGQKKAHLNENKENKAKQTRYDAEFRKIRNKVGDGDLIM